MKYRALRRKKREYNLIYLFKGKVFLLAFLFSFSLSAQESKIFFEPSAYYGRIIRHTTPFPEIRNNTLTLALNLTKKPNGNKLWHRLYHLSGFGLGIIYSYFGDKDTLGSAIGLLPHLTFSNEKNRKVKFYYSLGTGLAYVNRPYDIFVNEDNNVIGSHLNNISYLNFGVEWSLSPRFSVKPSVSLIHYSNGRAKLPNLGYNIPSFSLSGKIFLANDKREVKRDSMPPTNKKIHFGGELGYGFNQLKNSRGPVYSLYSGKLFASKNITLKNKLSAGIEYVFDSGIYSYMQLHDVDTENQKLHAARIICFAAHEFLIGHLGFLTQGGFFLNKPFDTGTNFPTKLGLQYYFFTPYFREHHYFYMGIYLAAHSFEADYVAFGIGYNY